MRAEACRVNRETYGFISARDMTAIKHTGVGCPPCNENAGDHFSRRHADATLPLTTHRLVSRPNVLVIRTNPSFWDILCARTLCATALAGAAPHTTADLTGALVTL